MIHLKNKIGNKSDDSTQSTSIKRTLTDDEDTVGFETPQVLNNDAKKCKRVSFNLLYNIAYLHHIFLRCFCY